MDYEQFISSVEDALGPAQCPATLRTLADRLSGVQIRQVVVRLAAQLAATPLPRGPIERVDLDGFQPGIARRRPGQGIAQHSADVVFATMLDLLSPQDYEQLATSGVGTSRAPQPPMVSVVPLSVFFDNVAPPAQVTPDTTGRFADAVVEALAERIAPVAIDELVGRLPVEMHPVLKHARDVYPATGRHVRLQRLLDHVAERDDDCPALAAQPARPLLTVRAQRDAGVDRDPDIDPEQGVAHLAFRLPAGYTVSWLGA